MKDKRLLLLRETIARFSEKHMHSEKNADFSGVEKSDI
jgi:hypothetical protein